MSLFLGVPFRLIIEDLYPIDAGPLVFPRFVTVAQLWMVGGGAWGAG